MIGSATARTGEKVDFRAYDKARMQKIALGIWAGMIMELKDEQGAVYLPMGEVLDAMALVAGMMMATHPDAKTPSKLREMCSEHAKNLAERTRQGIANPEAARIFDAVLTDGDRFN